MKHSARRGSQALRQVLFLCTGNCVRSQMAEALLNYRASGRLHAESGGSNPAGFVHPHALQVLKEIHIRTGGLKSVKWDLWKDQSFDAIITLCPYARAAILPAWPAPEPGKPAPLWVHWPFPDPSRAEVMGEMAHLAVFREVRESMRECIERLILAPESTLCDDGAFEALLREIEGWFADAQAEGAAPDATPALTPMQVEDVPSTASLIARAMNASEGEWSKITMEMHFHAQASQIDDGRQYFIYRSEGEVQGIAGLHHYNWGPRQNVWLAWFALDPSLQGQGYGRMLLKEMEKQALRQGYSQMLIETYSSPEFARARQLYEKAGYEKRGGIRGYIPGVADMVVYGKALG